MRYSEGVSAFWAEAEYGEMLDQRGHTVHPQTPHHRKAGAINDGKILVWPRETEILLSKKKANVLGVHQRAAISHLKCGFRQIKQSARSARDIVSNRIEDSVPLIGGRNAAGHPRAIPAGRVLEPSRSLENSGLCAEG